MTILNETYNILRNKWNLREKAMREDLWAEVREKYPNAKFSTIERYCRLIQNKNKQCLNWKMVFC